MRGVLHAGLFEGRVDRLPHPAPGYCRLYWWYWHFLSKDVLRGLDGPPVRARTARRRLAAVGAQRRLRDWSSDPTALRRRHAAHRTIASSNLLFGYRAHVLPAAVHARR